MTPASTAYLIREYACRGAVLFSNSKTLFSGYFNPSVEQHASMYFGPSLVSFLVSRRIPFPLAGLDDATAYVIEFNTEGMRAVPLDAFIASRVSVKVYYYTEACMPASEVMSLAAAFAFDELDKRYGLGDSASYCFKMVAHCYARAGVPIATETLLGKDVVLSQSFTQDARWLRVYDSLTGLSLLPWRGDYLEWRLDG
uniref:Protein OPG091 n=1 Tax=Rousettus bat poxvirus TaxID=3141933 RepID=A0AAU7E201_9POXV